VLGKRYLDFFFFIFALFYTIKPVMNLPHPFPEAAFLLT